MPFLPSFYIHRQKTHFYRTFYPIFVNIGSSLFQLFLTAKKPTFTALSLIINELHITFFNIGYTWLHLFFKAVYPKNALFARVSGQVTPFSKNRVKSLGFFYKIY